MPTADDFLQAIIADPDDDAPRLQYADWLDEQGDAVRAEFIRVQISLARMDEGDERRKGPQKREQELLEANHEKWLGDPINAFDVQLRGRYRFDQACFRRGMLEAVTVDATSRPPHLT